METERHFWYAYMYGADQDAFDRWEGSDWGEPGRRWFDAYDWFNGNMALNGVNWYAEA